MKKAYNKTYIVTLYRYPEVKGEKIFTFEERARNEEEALSKAKEKFEHSVYESTVEESTDDIVDASTEGFSYDLETTANNDTNIAKYYMDGELIAEAKFSGSGTAEIISIDNKKVLDALADLVWQHRRPDQYKSGGMLNKEVTFKDFFR